MVQIEGGSWEQTQELKARSCSTLGLGAAPGWCGPMPVCAGVYLPLCTHDRGPERPMHNVTIKQICVGNNLSLPTDLPAPCQAFKDELIQFLHNSKMYAEAFSLPSFTAAQGSFSSNSCGPSMTMHCTYSHNCSTAASRSRQQAHCQRRATTWTRPWAAALF